MNMISAETRHGVGAHYDRATIVFHWLTALLVVLLFGSAWLWNNTPRDWHWHPPLEALHVSFGILFAVVLVARVGWRLWRGRRLGAADSGLSGWASKTVHFSLYLLLGLQAALGFGLRWLQGESFSFFGLFAIPDPFTPDRQFAQFLEPLHNYIGWTIVIVAGGHAVAALVHHFLLRDKVLGRMVPAAVGPAA